jgi:hypothetical protein
MMLKAQYLMLKGYGVRDGVFERLQIQDTELPDLPRPDTPKNSTNGSSND